MEVAAAEEPGTAAYPVTSSSFCEVCRVPSAIALYASIVCIGAGIFSAVERPAELIRRSEQEAVLVEYTATFERVKAAALSGCISDEDLSVLTKHAPAPVAPADFHDWDFAGAFFFSCTIVSTIGYGTFAPATTGGRVFLIFYALIGIGAAAPVFAFLGEFIIKKVRLCMGSSKPKPAASSAEVQLAFGKYDLDRSGTLDRSEIAAAIEDMDVDVTVSELTRLIAETDTDGSGELDSQEFAQMLSAVTMKKHADEVDSGANRDLCVTLSVVLFLVLAGAGIFCALNDSWSYFDSIYFCIITLTTIGLGDYAPDIHTHDAEKEQVVVHGALFFWFLYVQFGLAIVAVVLSMIGDKIQAIAIRAQADIVAAKTAIIGNSIKTVSKAHAVDKAKTAFKRSPTRPDKPLPSRPMDIGRETLEASAQV